LTGASSIATRHSDPTGSRPFGGSQPSPAAGRFARTQSPVQRQDVFELAKFRGFASKSQCLRFGGAGHEDVSKGQVDGHFSAPIFGVPVIQRCGIAMISHSPRTIVDRHQDNPRQRRADIVFFVSLQLEQSKPLPCPPSRAAARSYSLSAQNSLQKDHPTPAMSAEACSNKNRFGPALHY
jgi:hypothetical protein